MSGTTVGVLALTLWGCGGEDTELLAKLTGSWSGSITIETGALPLSAQFDYDDEDRLLTGEVVVSDPAPDVPHTYAVRRWETIRGVVYLDLTDAEDGTRALDLDGEVAGSFDGDAVVRYPCGPDTCGYEGTFQLVSGATPPPGGSGTTSPTTTPTTGGSGT